MLWYALSFGYTYQNFFSDRYVCMYVICACVLYSRYLPLNCMSLISQIAQIKPSIKPPLKPLPHPSYLPWLSRLRIMWRRMITPPLTMSFTKILSCKPKRRPSPHSQPSQYLNSGCYRWLYCTVYWNRAVSIWKHCDDITCWQICLQNRINIKLNLRIEFFKYCISRNFKMEM